MDYLYDLMISNCKYNTEISVG